MQEEGQSPCSSMYDGDTHGLLDVAEIERTRPEAERQHVARLSFERVLSGDQIVGSEVIIGRWHPLPRRREQQRVAVQHPFQRVVSAAISLMELGVFSDGADGLISVLSRF